ncbi:hypothetical protein BRADI_1g01830v3 [Brachypodium distachyon]|uniref:Uncharacterized protein n=1 Tax=Brachypodium distachyon TaxID=15368 RepID=A0A0Q3GM37_BRADI|nr:hypothetical protein BRADI_1g01830v3 [Brachypodium distachyon]
MHAWTLLDMESTFFCQEKHKEKKHKKDKKDKERKEGKEKKDKDRSKDKHRDKKDRKEKHKDKKDKSKDKSRESEEGAERHGEAPVGQKSGESSRKSEEIKDPKFREDLVRKAQEEKGAEKRAAENFAVPNERSREVFSAAPALENERNGANKMRIQSINASRKNEGLAQQNINLNQQKNGTAIRRGENLNSSSQRDSDGLITAPTVEKGRVEGTRPLPKSTDSAPRKEGIGQRINNISILVQKRSESPDKEIRKKEIGTSSPLHPSPANTMQKGNGKVGRPMDNAPASKQRFDSPSASNGAAGMDRSLPRSTIPSPSITIRRPNGMARPPESFSISTKKPNAGGISPAMGREKEPGGRMLQNNVSTDQKLVGSKAPAVGKEKETGGRTLQNNVSTDQKLLDSKPPAVEKAAVGRAERVEKVRDGAPDVAKKEDKKRDRHEKKKRKEKDKHKEKKKEKEAKKEKEEHNHKEHDKLRENSINYQIDSLHTKPVTPPSAPPADDAKAILVDENLKKRKNHEMNGHLQNHHDMRPTKLPRPAPSSNHVENGTASHVAAPLSSMKPDAINIEKAERLHKKEEKVNGNKEAQRPLVDSGHRDPHAASGNGSTPPKKSPHPDCKYLGQIYTIPEAPQMMECEVGDQDWLFEHSSTQSEKPKSEIEADGAAQVWAQAVRLDSADVIALPYVIPF